MTVNCVCCGNWMDVRKQVKAAAQVNQSGPYCDMCRCGIMFFRYAKHRGVKHIAALVHCVRHEKSRSPKL